MTMVCPRCQVAYQGGQVCPSCGTYLVPYQPLPQPPIQQPMYEYSPEPACEAAEAPVASASPSKGRTTVAIAVLSVLVALLTALCSVLLLRPAPEPEVVEKVVETPVTKSHPTATEQAAADSGWMLCARLYGASSTIANDMLGTATEPPDYDDIEQEAIILGDLKTKEQVNDLVESLAEEYPTVVEAWQQLYAKYNIAGDFNSVPESERNAYIENTVAEEKVALEGYKQACADAGFSTTSWNIV